MFCNNKILFCIIVYILINFINGIPPSYVDPEELRDIVSRWTMNNELGIPNYIPEKSNQKSQSKYISLFHVLTPAKFFDSLFTIGNVQMIVPNKPLSKNNNIKNYNRLTATFGK
uniref:Uncharacterized protein n=1 Tax=Parastrongyloides trichosuri TaxID=131310 RepID=A0A0N4ZPT3_PARTI